MHSRSFFRNPSPILVGPCGLFSEQHLQDYGQQVGRPPVRGGRASGTHVEEGGLGDAQEVAFELSVPRHAGAWRNGRPANRC